MLSWSSAAPKLRTANNLSVSKTKLRETAGLHGWGGRLLGCLMYALSLNLFLAGNHIAAGGLGGVAVALTTIIPMRLSALVLIMNIHLLVLGWAFKGWRFIRNTIVCAMAYTVLVEATSYLPTLTYNPLFAALCGGAMYGLALALMTITNSSIGGTEIAVRVLLCRFPTAGTGRMCLIVDSSVVLLSMVLSHDIEIGLIAILTLFVCSVVADRISLGDGEIISA